MTEKGGYSVLMYLSAAYPNAYKNMTETDAKASVRVWQDMFEDDDDETVMEAVKACMRTNKTGFPPSIGEVTEKINKIKSLSFGPKMTALEASLLVRKALRNGYYGAQEEFDKLPERIQQVLGGPGQLYEWSQLDPTGVNVVMAHFQKAYEARTKYEDEWASFPSQLQNRILEERRAAMVEANGATAFLNAADSGLDPDRHFTPEERRARWAACEVNFDEED